MQFTNLNLHSVGLALAAAALASASAARAQFQALPPCAVTCADNAIGATGCSATDAACLCASTSFLTAVESCISTACSAADQEETLRFAQQFCSGVGVPITLTA